MKHSFAGSFIRVRYSRRVSNPIGLHTLVDRLFPRKCSCTFLLLPLLLPSYFAQVVVRRAPQVSVLTFLRMVVQMFLFEFRLRSEAARVVCWISEVPCVVRKILFLRWQKSATANVRFEECNVQKREQSYLWSVIISTKAEEESGIIQQPIVVRLGYLSLKSVSSVRRNQSVNKRVPSSREECFSSFGWSKYATKIEELRRAMLTLSHSGDDLAKSLAGALTITRTPKEQFSDKVRRVEWWDGSCWLFCYQFFFYHTTISESLQADWVKVN